MNKGSNWRVKLHAAIINAHELLTLTVSLPCISTNRYTLSSLIHSIDQSRQLFGPSLCSQSSSVSKTKDKRPDAEPCLPCLLYPCSVSVSGGIFRVFPLLTSLSGPKTGLPALPFSSFPLLRPSTHSSFSLPSSLTLNFDESVHNSAANQPASQLSVVPPLHLSVFWWAPPFPLISPAMCTSAPFARAIIPLLSFLLFGFLRFSWNCSYNICEHSYFFIESFLSYITPLFSLNIFPFFFIASIVFPDLPNLSASFNIFHFTFIHLLPVCPYLLYFIPIPIFISILLLRFAVITYCVAKSCVVYRSIRLNCGKERGSGEKEERKDEAGCWKWQAGRREGRDIWSVPVCFFSSALSPLVPVIFDLSSSLILIILTCSFRLIFQPIPFRSVDQPPVHPQLWCIEPKPLQRWRVRRSASMSMIW